MARFISAIPGNRGDAVLWGEALGARHALHVRLPGPWFCRPSPRHADKLGDDHGRRLSGRCEPGAVFRRERVAIPNRPPSFSTKAAGAAFVVFDERIARDRPTIRGFPPSRRRPRDRLGRQRRPNRAADGIARGGVHQHIRGHATFESRGGDRYVRPRLFQPSTVGPAIEGGARDGRAFSYARRVGGRPTRARAARRRKRVAEPFRGGAARGKFRGSTAAGYLSGNGLLTAVVLGRVAGARAADNSASIGARGSE